MLRGHAAPVLVDGSARLPDLPLAPPVLAGLSRAHCRSVQPEVLTADDVGLWWTVVGQRLADAERLLRDDRSPLFEQSDTRPIEVWTESELSGIHALWRLVQEHGSALLRGRLRRAVDWHLEHTQPDNATNRPWALHVFLLLGSDEGRLYAETLLHNSMATTGEPTLLCALILEDAARCIEESLTM